jgi:S-adenosylmethionine:tRNA ribosyltransferase-isomerase
LNIKDNIPVADYDYNLPEGKIAEFPLPERDQSKLLVYIKGKPIEYNIFRNLADYIDKDKVLVINNTRVVKARLGFKKKTGANIEILCVSPVDPPDFELAFQKTGSCTWKCIVGNLKKWKSSFVEKSFTLNGAVLKLIAEKVSQEGGTVIIKFSWNNDLLSFADILEITGTTPLPPYIKRKAVKLDQERYQTVYSKYEGSVAAPTAGLHLTDHVFNELKKKNIRLLEVTLHVGPGTFQPVKEKNAHDHKMHTEMFIVGRNTVKYMVNSCNKIIAVGTTTVRTLESIYWLGVKLMKSEPDNNGIISLGQWEHYDLQQNIDTGASLDYLYNYMKNHGLDQLFADTQIMIVPGYKFRLTGGMITNFHLPKSTLLMLVAAYTGKAWKDIYDYALNNDFRLLSYGDCSFLL